MKYMLWTGLAGLLFLAGTMTGAGQENKWEKLRTQEWQSLLARRIELFGHRNWIVIADSAYPAQTRAGIETIVTGSDHLEVVKVVLDQLAHARHVRPIVYMDGELPHVNDKDAPGIEAYRQSLKTVLAGREPQMIPHVSLIDRLDKTAEKFKVLILKTNLTLPYTSVFLELDCGYWSPDAEQRLRKAIGTEK
jgi:L-fucose mutarotase/ribose pyranase (RbsD/FucU family)